MSKGVVRIESDVFHFPPAKDTGLSDFYKPHAAIGMPAGGPSLTRQEFKEECDVNEIVRRFAVTGVLPAVGEPLYFDFTSVPMDMMSAMEMMRNASDAFFTLDAHVRREFDNDPAKFVDFAGDAKNLDQMIAWGLAPPKQAQEAPEVLSGPFGDPATPDPKAKPAVKPASSSVAQDAPTQ